MSGKTTNKTWGYEASESCCPPADWPKLFPVGDRQSPINILLPNDHHMSPGEMGKLASPRSQARRSSAGSPSNDSAVSSSSSASSQSTSPSHSSGASSGRSSPGSGHAHWAASQEAATLTIKSRPGSNNSGKQTELQQKTRLCTTNKEIFLGYPRYLRYFNLENNGHSWQLSLEPEVAANTLIYGPPFGDCEYQFAQLHCHWGAQNSNEGSEHQINGKNYAAELHFVHWNCSKFKSIQEASQQRHGLAVLAVLVEVEKEEKDVRSAGHRHLEKIASAIESIKSCKSKTRVEGKKLDLKKLFPANRWSYATYEGSLTTPPLSEVVDWLVFLQPIRCSQKQLDRFRSLECHPISEHSKSMNLLRNHRPVQATNDRIISIWSQH